MNAEILSHTRYILTGFGKITLIDGFVGFSYGTYTLAQTLLNVLAVSLHL